MKLNLLHQTILLAAIAVSQLNCTDSEDGKDRPEIAVANSYLKCVVSDLAGGRTQVLCLTPPGMCPGHFDISPPQIDQLRGCRILLLFDFQSSLEDMLKRLQDKGLEMHVVRPRPGLCIPDTYMGIAEDVSEILSTQYPARRNLYEKRLAAMKKRLGECGDEAVNEIRRRRLNGSAVLASDHQDRFCAWLGLEVTSTFSGRDVQTASGLNRSLRGLEDRSIRFVIANKQEGTGLAEALADHLGARMVVFSNFPDASTGENQCLCFDRLMQRNLSALFEAAGR